MATKKLQILGSLTAKDADTLDGKHAEEFAAASDVAKISELVGDKAVSLQINEAVDPVEDRVATMESQIGEETVSTQIASAIAEITAIPDSEILAIFSS